MRVLQYSLRALILIALTSGALFAQPLGAPAAQPLGAPAAQPLGAPAAQPLGAPAAQHEGHNHAPGEGHGVIDTAVRTEPWSKEVVEAFATLPVQDGGRVKPMDSLAGLSLLTLNGKRTLKLEDGDKLSHNEWLLDVFFFPGQARKYPCFRVQNDAVLTLIGVESKSKRDWYSYEELLPAQQKLLGEAQRFSGIEASKQNEVQRQTLKLFKDLRTFEGLLGTLEFARMPYVSGDSEALKGLFGDVGTIPLEEILGKATEFRALFSSLNMGVQGAHGGQEIDAAQDQDYDACQALFGDLQRGMDASMYGPTMFPPPDGITDPLTWWSVASVVDASFTDAVDVSSQIELVGFLSRLEAQKNSPAAFAAELQEFNVQARSMTEARGEYGFIPLEVKMYRWDLFTNALVLFLVAFLLSTTSWLLPKSKWPVVGTWLLTSLGAILIIVGIVMRCIIRQRPPVVSLYDTILFITGSIVVVTLIMEALTRRRVAIGIGTLLGLGGMFLAGRYELKEVASAGDTMASVVAVLDTNYYLAIHVTTVTLGYAGGLLAAGIAHVWILGQLFGFARGDTAFYKTITRMIYGVLCFCLIFSVFGTIMGGVWANDSWGRFWGWDPKENGALLICLWVLMVLHARLGGYVADRGVAVLAVLTGVVVSISWWGVNLLNVGLHSYGFTSGVAMLLMTYWGSAALVVLVSGVDWLVRKNAVVAVVSAPPGSTFGDDA